MTIFYSPSARGFYASALHAEIPVDAVEITAEEYAALLAAQSEGAVIQPGEDGRPVAVRPDPLEVARATAKAAAKAQFDARIAAGMPWQGKVLQIDDASQERILAGKAMADAGTLPAGFAWRMADNTPLPLDAAGMQAMAEAAGTYVYALRAHYWSLVDAIAAAPDLAAVQAIDVTAGWPE
ncbi:MAG: DUF4376 domain-containing protein [Microbispora sp.]|nr:DUF4376 domain-containing protein [Microbispora sp.]